MGRSDESPPPPPQDEAASRGDAKTPMSAPVPGSPLGVLGTGPGQSGAAGTAQDTHADSAGGTTSSAMSPLAHVPSGPAYSAFPKATKKWIIGMVAFSSFISPMTANIYFPAIPRIASDLEVSVALINLTLTTYMITQGISPTIFGDFGDMAGRRPAFIVAFTIYIGANIGLALQDNYAALMVLRCLQSAGSSGTLALGYAVVADIAVSGERGKYMAAVNAGVQIGPAISPVLGGILAEYLSWRAIFWFCVIFTGVWMVPYVLFVPETSRKVVGNGSIPATGWNMTLVEYLRTRKRPQEKRQQEKKTKFYVPNPFTALAIVWEKDSGLILGYNSLLYLVFMVVMATLSTEFASIYRLNDLQIGLCFLPYGLGCTVAAFSNGYILDWNYRRIARKIGFKIDMRRGDNLATFPIEKARLQPVVPLLVVGTCSTIAYGWVLQAEVNLAVPLSLCFIIGVCINGSFGLLNTLIVDIYPDAPATATAANNLVRCTMGAIVMSFIEHMLRAMGRGWCYTFWALLCAALSPVLWVIMRWGPKWREERRVRKAEKEAKAAHEQN